MESSARAGATKTPWAWNGNWVTFPTNGRRACLAANPKQNLKFNFLNTPPTAPSFVFPELNTARLLLRGFQDTDFEAVAAMYAEPDFAQFITFNGQPYGIDMAWRTICTMAGHWVLRGYGFWAVEEKSSGALVGFVGPHYPADWPGQEVGWAIAKPHWGKGYATEAARAAIDYAARVLGWRHVIHVIHPDNVRSAAVALKLGSKPESTWVRNDKDLTLYGQDLYGQDLKAP